MIQRTAWIAVVVAIAVLGSAGCVTKKVYRKDVAENEARIGGVESAVEANERRISDLSRETDDKIAQAQGTAERAVEIGNSAMGQAAAAQEAAEKAARGKLLWEVTLTDENVRFSFGQAQLPDEAISELDDLVAKVKSLDRAVYLEIQGHTDNIGGEEYNYQLGDQRASAVRNYLNGQGIPLHAMSTISYGESHPVVDNDTPENRAKNRRVVILVLE